MTDPINELAYARPPANGLDMLRQRINSRRRRARFAGSAAILIAAITTVFWPEDAIHRAELSETSIARFDNDGPSLKIKDGAAMEVPTDRENVRLYWVMALDSERQTDPGA